MKTSTPCPTLCRSIGAAIRATRKSHPLTLEALSAASGVATGCISVLERGESNPTIDTINKLAVAMNTTPASLLRYAEHLSTAQN